MYWLDTIAVLWKPSWRCTQASQGAPPKSFEKYLKLPRITCFACISLESVPGLGEPPCKCSDTNWHRLDAQDTVEIPYTPVGTTFVELTSFRPSFLDSSSPGLTLTPMKCVQNKKLMILPTGFTDLLKKLHDFKKIRWIWKKTLNLALPTGGSKKLKYWETTVLLIWSKTIGTQTHVHTHIHSQKYWFWTFRTFLLYVLIS